MLLLLHCANDCAGNKLEVGVLLRRAMDICCGLQEVHAMGIIMRDLKPVSHAQLQAVRDGLDFSLFFTNAPVKVVKAMCALALPLLSSWCLQANVLVAESGTAVLADFGLARAVVGKLGTTKTQGAGTLQYM